MYLLEWSMVIVHTGGSMNLHTTLQLLGLANSLGPVKLHLVWHFSINCKIMVINKLILSFYLLLVMEISHY